MTDWFARPVLHVSSVEASLRFYVDRLGFTVPWRVLRRTTFAWLANRSSRERWQA
jgi:catechol 2,3-dioxygenase-like lactoylglutathione lyase family enzyme